jgi:hypothetical protein
MPALLLYPMLGEMFELIVALATAITGLILKKVSCASKPSRS